MNQNVIMFLFQVAENGELGIGEEGREKTEGEKEMIEERRVKQKE